MLSEANIIAKLQRAFPSHIGDDAAIIHPTPALASLVTTDLLVEHKHFNTAYVDATSLAHKALHVNLSDLAAMSATPRFVLLSIAIPPRHAAYANVFLDAFTQACLDANVVLIGGDTTASDRDLFINVTAIGEAHSSHVKGRSKATPGDVICVIGELGLAHVGLMAFENQFDGFFEEKAHFLKPTAKLEEGCWLGQQNGVTTLMDISDGLFIDLTRLCKASHVGAELNLNALTITDAFKQATEALAENPLTVMLTGGEDYGLLCTITSSEYAFLSAAFNTHFNQPLKKIGVITSSTDVTFTQDEQPVTLTLTPFNHFGESL